MGADVDGALAYAAFSMDAASLPSFRRRPESSDVAAGLCRNPKAELLKISLALQRPVTGFRPAPE